jgi:hypothetical protein
MAWRMAPGAWPQKWGRLTAFALLPNALLPNAQLYEYAINMISAARVASPILKLTWCGRLFPSAIPRREADCLPLPRRR